MASLSPDKVVRMVQDRKFFLVIGAAHMNGIMQRLCEKGVHGAPLGAATTASAAAGCTPAAVACHGAVTGRIVAAGASGRHVVERSGEPRARGRRRSVRGRRVER